MGRRAKRPYYICIFYKNIYPKRCVIAYTTDCDKKLAKTNATARNSLYVCYCQYKTVESAGRSKLMKYIYRMYPDVVVPFSTNQYMLNLSPEDAYRALEAYARDTNSLDNIKLIDTDLGEQKTDEPEDTNIFDEAFLEVIADYIAYINKTTPKINNDKTYPTVKLYDKLNKNLIIKITQEEKLIGRFEIKYPNHLYYSKLDNSDKHFLISPDETSFKEGFSVALNDTIANKINIFNIPPKAIDSAKLHKLDNRYLMRIVNDGTSFEDTLSGNFKTSLLKYYVGSIQYVYGISENDIVDRNHLEKYPTATLSILDYLDVYLYTPLAIVMNKIKYDVYNYLDFLDVSLNLFYQFEPNGFLDAIKYEDNSKSILKYLSTNPTDLKEPHRIKDTDIYFEGQITDKIAHYIVRYLYGKLDTRNLQFQIILMRKFQLVSLD